jgi:hypothetical protein
VKKLIAILLLGILTYGQVGYVLIFKLMVTKIRQNERATLCNGTGNQPLTVLNYNSLTSVCFSEIEDNELSYNGERYDIVKQEKSENGSTVFYCIEDEPETALISHLNGDVVNNLDSQSHKNTPTPYRFIVDWYVLPTVKCDTYPITRVKTAPITVMRQLHAPVIGFQTPPPKPA